jgi:hypothetical protein
MHGSFTSTASQTNTFTDARLRAVMPEVGGDFYAMACSGIISLDTAQRWTDELTYILQNQTAHGFQIQLTYANGQKVALDYRVSNDGSIRESSFAGGIDYYALPLGPRPSCLSISTTQRRGPPRCKTICANVAGDLMLGLFKGTLFVIAPTRKTATV